MAKTSKATDKKIRRRPLRRQWLRGRQQAEADDQHGLAPVEQHDAGAPAVELAENRLALTTRQGLAQSIAQRQGNGRMQRLITIVQRQGATQTPPGIRQEVVHNIQQYDAIIDQVATEEGIHPNLVRGIIAAESGGRANAGAASGYKGLMQAGRGAEQLDPATSLRTGIRKYLQFARGLHQFLTRHGADPAALTGVDEIRRVMVAYNAGPGTVKKAMEYALAAGDQRLEHWLEPEHFQRALIYYGAYDIKGLLRRGLAHLDGDALLTELGALTGKRDGELRQAYFNNGKWNLTALRAAITTAVNDQRKQLRKKNLTLAEAQAQASHWIIEAVTFKHNNLRAWYVDRVLHYMNYFNQTRPVQELVIEEPEVIEAD